MNFKFLILFFFMFNGASNLIAQSWLSIFPMESKRDDILQILKSENSQTLSDEVLQYDLPDRLLNYKFYKGGCSETEEKELGLSDNILIQRKDSPKGEFSAQEFLGGNFKFYNAITTSPDKKIYINSNDGICVIEDIIDDKQIVRSIFYFPKLPKIPTCLLKKLDTTVQNAIETSKTIKLPNKNNHYPILYTPLSNSKYYWNELVLNNFSDILRDSENRKGYVIVYAGKKAKPNEALLWIKKLENYLIMEKKVNANQVTFIDGGYREFAMAVLFVVKKFDDAPKPTPTILPGQVQIIKSKNN